MALTMDAQRKYEVIKKLVDENGNKGQHAGSDGYDPTCPYLRYLNKRMYRLHPLHFSVCLNDLFVPAKTLFTVTVQCTAAVVMSVHVDKSVALFKFCG